MLWINHGGPISFALTRLLLKMLKGLKKSADLGITQVLSQTFSQKSEGTRKLNLFTVCHRLSKSKNFAGFKLICGFYCYLLTIKYSVYINYISFARYTLPTGCTLFKLFIFMFHKHYSSSLEMN